MKIRVANDRFIWSLLVRFINKFYKGQPKITASVTSWIDENGDGEYSYIEPSLELSLDLPVNDSGGDRDFRKHSAQSLPTRYLARIHDVIIRGYHGLVVLSDGSYCVENTKLSYLLGSEDYSNLIVKRGRKLSGNYFSLHVPYCVSHYHWLHDALPRLHRVIDRLPSDIRYLIPDTINENQRRMLGQLGIGPEMLESYSHVDPVEVENLYFTPLLAGNLQERPASILWLKSQLWPERQSVSTSSKKRLYVSRKLAPFRQVHNEGKLQTVLKEYGFEIVYPEQLEIEEQISMFAEASVIVGPHGAGLVNAMFMRENSIVLEIFPSVVNFRTYFWSLSSVCGHRYYYMKGTDVPGADWGEIYVSPENLRKMFELIL